MYDKYEINTLAFAKALQSGKNLNGKDALLKPLIKPIQKLLWGALSARQHCYDRLITRCIRLVVAEA